MDKRADIIKNLIFETGLNQKAFAQKIGIPYTTLRSMLQRGIGNASVDNVIKVCKGLGITTDQLENMSKDEQHNSSTTDKELPQLNAKDQKDIEIELQKLIDGLSGQNGYAAFDGQTMEDMDKEDRELLIASLETSLKLAKRLAKQKFTPKKYLK
ncbi:transcriptional regulator with XRE-family HTH domain [Cytobacillus horneckiae]|uniref:helix-turn-helix domain-containing protein n=1 Tax=Cytobacillus horneckiae TaxID=549687 RepID=UPI000A00A8BD|nr:helix-turn-helix transcriptional regulator [Cytobacillus horneckiae]MCM3178910.1 helix-turn-helix domain-containing protein [Cytobacillus horneckiae]MEC1154120.1 helix-turn-helix transcriptional regulator [Cytobacillus horneckiae]MED2936335.1 helix-turn-helix transcriptional regulator [Cytobacillus horneckiae]